MIRGSPFREGNNKFLMAPNSPQVKPFRSDLQGFPYFIRP